MGKFDVKIEDDDFGMARLSITSDGNRWSTTRIGNPIDEVPQIIAVLKRYLVSIERDRSIPVQPKTRGRGKLFKEV